MRRKKRWGIEKPVLFFNISKILKHCLNEEGDEDSVIGGGDVIVVVDGTERDAVLFMSELGYLF